MEDPKNIETPDSLREKAERCFRLACETADDRVRALLVAYGHELLERAKALTGHSENGKSGH